MFRELATPARQFLSLVTNEEVYVCSLAGSLCAGQYSSTNNIFPFLSSEPAERSFRRLGAGRSQQLPYLLVY